jgi:hypothetical protein
MNERDHWLARPKTIRWLWRIFALVLAAVVLWQTWVPVHAHFGPDGWFGFHALFGFLACVGMVLFAKLLGLVLKRPEDYYDRDV